MVKGVSKTIIEVNDTGSKLFEKIVFYVTPEYGNLNAKQLKKAASNFSFHYQNQKAKSSKKRRFNKKTIVIASCVLAVALLITFLVIII